MYQASSDRRCVYGETFTLWAVRISETKMVRGVTIQRVKDWPLAKGEVKLISMDMSASMQDP